jgi:hypothetical protein
MRPMGESHLDYFAFQSKHLNTLEGLKMISIGDFVAMATLVALAIPHISHDYLAGMIVFRCVHIYKLANEAFVVITIKRH